jgi:molybdenum cofactor cytidylyltransferase
MICAVIPAAGESRRMGVPKQLLPFGTTTVIGHVVAELLQSALDEVYVVVSPQVAQWWEDRRLAAASSRRLSPGEDTGAKQSPGVNAGAKRPYLLTNDDPRADMLSSVRCGLRALPPECAAVVVVPGDQLAVSAPLVDCLVQSFRTAGKGILVPVYGGKRGHPLIFSARYCQEVLNSFDNVGLRGLLHAHPDDLWELSVSTSAVLCDIDYPGDYAREVARLESDRGHIQSRD